MDISTLCLVFIMSGFLEGLQHTFRSTPSLLYQTTSGFNINSPTTNFVIPYSLTPERLGVTGFGSFAPTVPSTSVEPSASGSTISFSNPPPPLGSGTDPASQTCGLSPSFCTESKYRSIDGSCNNLYRPTWGMGQTPYGRLTPYNYADGISAMARSVSGNQLPNPRELSLKLFPESHVVDPHYNLNTQQWGQIITHDMSLSAGIPQIGKHMVVCCNDNGQLAPDVTSNPVCAPILIPPNDPFHARQGTQCMNFVRSGSTRDRGCTSPNAPSQPITAVTGYMDLSLVYGSSASQAAPLRAGIRGRMLTSLRNGKEWPPQDPNVTSTCETAQSSNEPCYLAGDIRVNQNPQLTLLQVILLREHNRIADILAHLNPHWNDETIFQESRRILIAAIQHINYYEYLPILLGYENMVKNKLIYPEAHGYVNDYNPSVDPSVLAEHATAAYRHFHTLIRGYLQLVSKSRRLLGTVRMSDWFNRPLLLEIDGTFGKLARGLTSQEMDFSDQLWDYEITQYLFRRNNTFGGDLRATDIQRGRDHGLPSYVTARAACGLPVPNSFHDMLADISAENVAALQKLYESHEDVDLVVGGSLERPVSGALAGPTFLCILTEQFYRTRVGDRYFYENGLDSTTAFTPSQLQAIRKASMARLLCDNVDQIHFMQPQAFLLISHKNILVPCKTLPFIDLTLWQDARGHYKK